MPAEKCEWCGRFGAYKGKWIDPRGVTGNDKGYLTLYLCPRCWKQQNEFTRTLLAEMTPEDREKAERRVAQVMLKNNLRG